MVENYLISERQRKEELLNQCVIQMQTNEGVKKYYSQILDAAQSVELISMADRDQTAILLYKAIEERASGYVRGIVNQLHTVAIYLSSMSNVKALNEMINIKTVSEAQKFLDDAGNFLRKSQNELKVKLSKIRSKIQTGDPQIEEAYKILKRYVISLEDWAGNSSDFDEIFNQLLRFATLGTYIFVKTFLSDRIYCCASLVGKLHIIADAFETELSITKKMGFKEILRYRAERTKLQEEEAQKAQDALVKKIDQKRKKLQEAYHKRKCDFIEAEQRLDELYTQYYEYWGEVEDIETDSEDDEDAMMEEALGKEQFEEYQRLLKFVCDYEEKYANIDSDFSIAMERFEKKAEKALEKLRNAQNQEIDDYSNIALSLYDVLQEYAFYVLSTRPETLSYKLKVGNIPQNQAIQIALDNWEFLTEKEIEYLKEAKSGA